MNSSLRVKPLRASSTKWSNILKHAKDDKLFEYFEHFVGLMLKALTSNKAQITIT